MLELLSSNLMIITGAVLQTLAMLFRNQVVLRLMYILGGLCYVIFYIYVLPNPLWEAAAATIAIATTTLVGLMLIFAGRSEKLIPKDLFYLYEKMGHVNPGDFRLLLKNANRRTIVEEEVLTEQGKMPDKLYYIESGSAKLVKNGNTFYLNDGSFIGEVSLIMGIPASATVYATPNSQIIEWDKEILLKKTRSSEKLRLALDALIARDMASKVANTPSHNR